jgi:hypothetical protein
MERAGSTWTDERLDDLSRRVDNGFNRVDQELRSLRTELGDRIDRRADSLDARFDALQRTIFQVGAGMTVAILATLVSVLATQA